MPVGTDEGGRIATRHARLREDNETTRVRRLSRQQAVNFYSRCVGDALKVFEIRQLRLRDNFRNILGAVVPIRMFSKTKMERR
jgi:hypothetical protein